MKSYTINLGPSEKFSKKSVEVEIWDLALDLLLFVLFATPGNNCFLGWPGLAWRSAHDGLVGTLKLLPSMYKAL